MFRGNRRLRLSKTVFTKGRTAEEATTNEAVPEE